MSGLKLTGLDAGTAYEVRLQAENARGWGAIASATATTNAATETASATEIATAEATATETATAEATATETAEASATASATPAATVLRYNRRDTTGGATAAGSYAFLEDISDLTSGKVGTGWLRGYAEGLLAHRTDAEGVSRSAFYSEVAVGDEFTVWVTDDCWGHYAVTSVLADPPAPPRKRFAIGGVTYVHKGCDDTIAANAPVEFRWGTPPTLEVGTDGIPWARQDQPLDGGSAYRVSSGLVVDVPAGMTLIYRGWALNDNGTVTLRLEDEETRLLAACGRLYRRRTRPPDQCRAPTQAG